MFARLLSGSRSSGLWVCLSVIVLGLAVWGASVRYGFVWDDQYFIQNNTSLRSVRFLPRYFHDASTAASSDMASQFSLFRPLRNVSWMVDYQLAGLRPGWWHFHNVLLHLLNAWLVGLLAWGLVRRRDAQTVAALIFLLHPVVSETVCWVKCRDDLISTAFALWAAILWVRWRLEPFTWSRGATVGLVGLAACLAKEQAVVLPVLLAAMDLSRGMIRRAEIKDWMRRLSLPFLAVAVFLIWRWAVLGRTGQCDWLGGSAMRTWMTMVPAFSEYLRLLILPHPLLADYDEFPTVAGWGDPSLMCGALALGGVLVAGVLIAWRAPESRAGLAWALLALVPVSNLIPMMQYLAERFLYLPLVGIALAAGTIFARVRGRAWIVAFVGVAALFVWYGWLDIQRRGVWRDEVALFSATVGDAPYVLRPRRNLATALLRAGRNADSLQLTRDTWKMSRARRGETPAKRMEDAVNYAATLLVNGREEQGKALLDDLLREHPEAGWPHMHLGIYHARHGNGAEALAHFEQAVAKLPGEPVVLNDMGMALRDAGRLPEAEQAFREAVAKPNGGRDAFLNLAATLWKEGRVGEAAGVYRRMLERWPGDAEATRWLAEAERRSR